jgi:hypothetical protein
MHTDLPSRMGSLFGSLCLFVGHFINRGLGFSPSGNLCRCTGYRPIIDACRTFCKVSRRNTWLSIFFPNKTKQ